MDEYILLKDYVFMPLQHDHMYQLTKGTKMTKLEKLLKKRDKIDKEIEELKNKRWRAEEERMYYYVSEFGDIDYCYDIREYIDDTKHNSGNYFRTEEEAKQSLFYYALNSEYFYWIPGIEVPSELPDGCDYYNGGWNKEYQRPNTWEAYVRRWPK